MPIVLLEKNRVSHFKDEPKTLLKKEDKNRVSTTPSVGVGICVRG